MNREAPAQLFGCKSGMPDLVDMMTAELVGVVHKRQLWEAVGMFLSKFLGTRWSQQEKNFSLISDLPHHAGLLDFSVDYFTRACLFLLYVHFFSAFLSLLVLYVCAFLLRILWPEVEIIRFESAFVFLSYQAPYNSTSWNPESINTGNLICGGRLDMICNVFSCDIGISWCPLQYLKPVWRIQNWRCIHIPFGVQSFLLCLSRILPAVAQLSLMVF